jgi:hypothetical protein
VVVIVFIEVCQRLLQDTVVIDFLMTSTSAYDGMLMLASAYVPTLTAGLSFANLQVQDMFMLNYSLDLRMMSMYGTRISKNERYTAPKV